MKHFALALGICFAISFLLLGCMASYTEKANTSNDSNHSQVYGGINTASATPSTAASATAQASGQPTASAQASEGASATPQPTALSDEYLNSDGYKQLKQMTMDSAQAVLDDPRSSMDNLLNVAQTMKTYLLAGEDVDAMRAKIQEKLLYLLKTTQLCKKQYENLDEKAIGLGFDQAANIAKNRALTADVYCSSASYTYDYKDSDVKEAKTVKMIGNLKEHTLFGAPISADESKGYYFEDGKMDWTYDYQEREEGSCILHKENGGGTINLNNFMQGALTLRANGEYEGSFTVTVPITITEIKLTDVFVQEGDPNPCDTAQPQSSEGQDSAHIEFYGNTTDLKLVSGTNPQGGNEPDMNSVWHSQTTWNMKLP